MLHSIFEQKAVGRCRRLAQFQRGERCVKSPSRRRSFSTRARCRCGPRHAAARDV